MSVDDLDTYRLLFIRGRSDTWLILFFLRFLCSDYGAAGGGYYGGGGGGGYYGGGGGQAAVAPSYGGGKFRPHPVCRTVNVTRSNGFFLKKSVGGYGGGHFAGGGGGFDNYGKGSDLGQGLGNIDFSKEELV